MYDVVVMWQMNVWNCKDEAKNHAKVLALGGHIPFAGCGIQENACKKQHGIHRLWGCLTRGQRRNRLLTMMCLLVILLLIDWSAPSKLLVKALCKQLLARTCKSAPPSATIPEWLLSVRSVVTRKVPIFWSASFLYSILLLMRIFKTWSQTSVFWDPTSSPSVFS